MPIGNIKHIIVIESLNEVDGIIYTGEALYNDTIKRRIDLYNKDFEHNIHKVNSKESLIEIIKFYQFNSPYMQGGIVLHFEMHGDDKIEGLILSNGELINWEELSDLFRTININTCNNLFITLGTCNGRFLYKGVDPYKKSPYSGFISASIKVDPEEIYIKFGKLFEELIENGNIVDAYIEMEKTESNFYYKDSERIFKEAFSTTMVQFSKDPKMKREILEDAIKETEKETGSKLSSKETEIIFEKALNDMYLKQKSAFDFSDCN